jgi:hypothetical protein
LNVAAEAATHKDHFGESFQLSCRTCEAALHKTITHARVVKHFPRRRVVRRNEIYFDPSALEKCSIFSPRTYVRNIHRLLRTVQRRAKGAENASPGQRPGYSSWLAPESRALPWASVRRRVQRRKMPIDFLEYFLELLAGSPRKSSASCSARAFDEMPSSKNLQVKNTD